MNTVTEHLLKARAREFNDMNYFREDPIIFPRKMAEELAAGRRCRADVEISAIVSSHLAWGRRAMIVRDCTRIMDEMDWKPYDYVMKGRYRNDRTSLHRTIKWSDMAAIFSRLKSIYGNFHSLEKLSAEEIRREVFASKDDPKAPNKKIHMMRRWMVRDDGKVDIGIWKDSSPADLVIPLDVHVYTQASELGLTSRKQKDYRTARDITDCLGEIFPGDPCLGDFALFGYGVTHGLPEAGNSR